MLNAFDYLMMIPGRASRVFSAMLEATKLLLDIGVFPLEASNLAHWYVETTEMKLHFVAPQFLVMDQT